MDAAAIMRKTWKGTYWNHERGGRAGCGNNTCPVSLPAEYGGAAAADAHAMEVRPMMIRTACCVLALLLIVLVSWSAAALDELRLEKCVVAASPEGPGATAKAVELLLDEIRARTRLELAHQPVLPDNGVPAIVLGVIGSMPAGTPDPPAGLAVPQAAEGYAIWVDTVSRSAPLVCVVGRDVRGALFGAGRLLRALRMSEGRLLLDADFHVSTAPHYPVRGHELGYRNKSNTYDAWSVEQYEQYVRDLAVFGANTVTLLAELEHMDKDGPHMTETVAERTEKLTPIIGSYGLRVWIWLPPGRRAFQLETRDETLATCRTLFERCSPIDAVFVPGGDPGDAHPRLLLPWMEEMAAILRESHPDAEVWVSNEDMPHDWNDYLFDFLSREQPPWLTGVIFGTWVKLPIQTMRARIPAQYPISQYPDITHCIECQYPVHEWDRAFACTLGREPINPRPVAMAHIIDFTAPNSIGSTTYSDGVNDDVNKIVWTVKGWDPNANAADIMKEYGRYFVREDLGHDVAKGLLALEWNWIGPLLENAEVEKTLALWRSIEERAGKDAETNWRLQMGLFRAYYDAYVFRKLRAETEREHRAMKELADAENVGAGMAIARAREIFAEADSRPDAPDLRARIEQLGDGLFQTIGMQLSVDKYGAANWERGAVLDALDMPLNDRLWFESEFEKILEMNAEAARLARLETLLNWEDAGPGGFYDDLGNPTKQPHLVVRKEWAEDPGYVDSTQNEFIEVEGRKTWRKSWLDQAQTLYGTPLEMRYDNLDPDTAYTLRVVYTGRFRPTLRLVANGAYEIHGPLPQPAEVKPVEFAVPKEATAGGTLELEWQLVSGRGCQVAEIWLIPAEGGK